MPVETPPDKNIHIIFRKPALPKGSYILLRVKTYIANCYSAHKFWYNYFFPSRRMLEMSSLIKLRTHSNHYQKPYQVWWWMKGVISNRSAISNLNSKYVYFQYKDTTYIQMLLFCIIYKAAQSLWNVKKLGISPGGYFPQHGTPSWCRTLATQQRIRHINLKFEVKKIIVHPTPRWVPCTVSPQDSYDFKLEYPKN